LDIVPSDYLNVQGRYAFARQTIDVIDVLYEAKLQYNTEKNIERDKANKNLASKNFGAKRILVWVQDFRS